MHHRASSTYPGCGKTCIATRTRPETKSSECPDHPPPSPTPKNAPNPVHPRASQRNVGPAQQHQLSLVESKQQGRSWHYSLHTAVESPINHIELLLTR